MPQDAPDASIRHVAFQAEGKYWHIYVESGVVGFELPALPQEFAADLRGTDLPANWTIEAIKTAPAVGPKELFGLTSGHYWESLNEMTVAFSRYLPPKN